jgi:hypothetical protein
MGRVHRQWFELHTYKTLAVVVHHRLAAAFRLNSCRMIGSQYHDQYEPQSGRALA